MTLTKKAKKPTVTGRILIADDDASVRQILREALERKGHEVLTVEGVKALKTVLEKQQIDVLVTDVVMPDGDGIQVLADVQKHHSDLPVIVMSAKNTLSTTVRATQAGAFEYLPKPFDLNELCAVVKKAIKARTKAQTKATDSFDTETPLVGRSKAMQDVYRSMARVMGNDLTVLIEGESGTGKELVARAIHDMGHRTSGPFVAINMAAIPKDLIESELFGHEKGAFTGAESRYAGRFEEAAGGTLFLDEIGDMPMDGQTRLLRVLQQGEYRAVGARTAKDMDVRIIAASNKDLLSLVEEGKFREDLYFRLRVVPIALPPLRNRTVDIPELIARFMSDNAAQGLPTKRLGREAISILKKYEWPGNVRELQNLTRRLSALYAEDVITPRIIRKELRNAPKAPGGKGRVAAKRGESLSEAAERHIQAYFDAHLGSLPPAGLYTRIMQEVERPLIIQTLKATNGNQIKAAEILKINRNTLRAKLKTLKINPKAL